MPVEIKSGTSSNLANVDANGNLATAVSGTAPSTANSTNIPLAANATFTGVEESTSGYTSITVSIATDQNSATNGLMIEQSSDGLNWDFVQSFTITGSVNFNQTVAVVAAYFRIMYTNGTSPQGFFRLQAVKQLFNSSSSIVGSLAQGTPGMLSAGWPVKITDGLSVLGTVANPVEVSGAFNLAYEQFDSYSPSPRNYPTGTTASPQLDINGNTIIRGQVLTDEGSFRDDFPNTSFTTNLTGTVNFINGSTVITGVGTAFTAQGVTNGSWIKQTSDSETLYVRIQSVNSDTSITLQTPYQGITTSGTSAIVSRWQTFTPAGSSITVSASNLNLISSVTSGDIVGVLSGHGDSLPLTCEFYVQLSQAIPNQLVVFGFQDAFGAAASAQVVVELDGTNNVGNFVTATSSSVDETDDILFTFPENYDSVSAEHKYRISLSGDHTELSIDDIVVATNTIHIPGPYRNVYPVIYIQNTGIPSSSTTVTCDYIFLNNVDRLDVNNAFDDAQSVTITGPFRKNNVPVTVTPYNNLRVTQEATQIFVDTFSTSLDTTNRWNIGSGNGGSNPTSGGIDAGPTSFVPGTNVNGYSLLQSQPIFSPPIPAFFKTHWSVSLDYPVSTNNYRFWGFGTTLNTPNLTTPLIDAIGFEIGIDGHLYAVCYQGTAGTTTTRVQIADLSPSGSNAQPADSNDHLYFLWFNNYSAYWAVDELDNIVATLLDGELGPKNDNMPMTAISISNGTSGVLQINGVSVADTGHNSIRIADGAYNWRTASVLPPATQAATGNLPLVTALHPSSPLPAGTNNIGLVGIEAGQTIQATQGTSPWVTSVIGTVTVTPSGTDPINLTEIGGSNVGISNPLYVEVTDGTHTLPTGDSSARSIHTTVDNSTISVTGSTVAVSNAFALNTTLTNGSQHTIVDSGTITTITNPVTVAQGTAANLLATVYLNDGTGHAITSTSNALDVNIKSGATSTQYTQGQTVATPTGTVAMGYQSSTGKVFDLPLDSNGFLEVSVQGGITVTGGSFTPASDGATGGPVPSYSSFIGYSNAGTMTGVSVATPLPVTGTIVVANNSVGNTGAAVPVAATQIGYYSGGNLTVPSTINPLPVTSVITNTVNVQGTLTNNTATPVSNSVGVLSAIASYEVPGATQGNLMGLSVDLTGCLRTSSSQSATTLGDLISMPRTNQIEINFSEGFNTSTITNTFTGTATATAINGTAIYATGTTTGSRSIGKSTQQLSYRPGHEWYCYFTAAFSTGGSGSSWQRIGPFNSTDGFYLGYEANVVNFTQLQNTTAFSIPRSSWNGDPVDGSANSRFTDLGVPVAINWQNLNVFRIHGAWFGASPMSLDVFAPDGIWVTLHTFRFPNTLTTPFIYTTNLNIQVDVFNGTSTTNLSVNTPCWALGVVNESATSVSAANAFTWNSSTPVSTSVVVPGGALGITTIIIGLIQSTGITGGTITFQTSNDNINWYPINLINLQTAVIQSSYNFVANTNQSFIASSTGWSSLRLYLSSAIIGSGTVTAQYGTSGAGTNTVQAVGSVSVVNLPGEAAPGAAVPADMIVVGGSDGTDARFLSVDSSGRLQTNQTQFAGVSLGSTAIVNYGSTPAAVAVPAVNAFVTNTPAVSQSGNWTTRIVGNTGAVLDEPTGSATQAANLLQVGGWTTSTSPAYGNNTQEALSLTSVGSLRSDITSVAGTAVTAVPSTWSTTAPTGSVMGVNAALFIGGVTAANGTWGTAASASAGALSTNSSIFIGSTAATTTGTAGQMLIGVAGHTGVAFDAAQGATSAANAVSVSGTYLSTLPTLTSNQASALMLDAKGQQLIDVNYWAGSALGATAVTNYGSTPAAVAVPAVNAFITNTPTVTANAGTGTFTVGGTVTANQGGAPWSQNLTQVGGVTLGSTAVTNYGSTPAATAVPGVNAFVTNTIASNITQVAGATISKTNPLFTNIADGTNSLTAALSAWGTAPTGTFVMGVNANVVVALPAGTNTIGKVDILGNAGATLDATVGAGTAPTNMLVVGEQYNTTAPTPTNAQTMAMQADQSGNHLTFPGVQFKTGTTWTGGSTPIGTIQYPTGTTTAGQLSAAPAYIIQLDQTTTVTAGVVTIQGTYDNVNWVTVPVAQVLNPQTYAQLTNPYTLVASTNQPFLILTQGFSNIRLNVTTAFTGTGTVIPYWAAITAHNLPSSVFVRPQAPTTALWTHAIIAVSAASGTQSLIAGSGSTTIRVMKIQFTTNAATNIYFLDSTPTTLSGTYVLTGNGSSFADFGNGEPLWVSGSGKAFEINLSATATLGGDIWYTQS
jgi:hypothetical protein